MFSRVISAAIHGVEIELISVETDVGDGLPSFEMVGLLNSEVKESKERVRTSIKNSGMQMPPKRVTINLAPAGLRKEGGSFDLPIAVGVLFAMGYGNSNINMEETLIVGELSLDGRVNSIRGVLPIVMEGKKRGMKNFIVPKANVGEGAIVEGVQVTGVETLKEAWEILTGVRVFHAEHQDIHKLYQRQDKKRPLDFADIQGQENVKRAAEIAATGMHNLLMVGPPGTGKSMIAMCIPTILPKPDLEECIEITKIHSIAGTLDGEILMRERPFRAPHHTVTEKALIGGGKSARPGEITLAHRGVLFLDEFAEYRKETMDALRQPLENRKITISRVYGTYDFPADFMLAAAANPCKCGYYPDRTRCKCSEIAVSRYMARLSGPIMDRMDLCVGVPAVHVEELQAEEKTESSACIRKRVEGAVQIQRDRYKNTGIHFNASLTAADIKKYCNIGEAEKQLLRHAFDHFSMSARGYYKIIKVARTIADLEGSPDIREEHLSQALGYRMTV